MYIIEIPAYLVQTKRQPKNTKYTFTSFDAWKTAIEFFERIGLRQYNGKDVDDIEDETEVLFEGIPLARRSDMTGLFERLVTISFDLVPRIEEDGAININQERTMSKEDIDSAHLNELTNYRA